MTFTGHTDAVNAVDWNPTNNQFASVSLDGSLRIWDSGTGQLLITIPSAANPLFAVAYSPEGKKIAYGGENGAVEIYNICPCTLFGSTTPVNPPAVNLGAFLSLAQSDSSPFLHPNTAWRLFLALAGVLVSFA